MEFVNVEAPANTRSSVHDSSTTNLHCGVAHSWPRRDKLLSHANIVCKPHHNGSPRRFCRFRWDLLHRQPVIPKGFLQPQALSVDVFRLAQLIRDSAAPSLWRMLLCRVFRRTKSSMEFRLCRARGDNALLLRPLPPLTGVRDRLSSPSLRRQTRALLVDDPVTPTDTPLVACQ